MARSAAGSPEVLRRGRRREHVAGHVSARRGSVLVLTMWVLIILVALVLTFSHTVRVEVAASGNRQATMRAAAVEAGVEQYVMALAELSKGDSTLVTDVSLQQVALGDGYFWVMRPDPIDDANHIFGIADEAAKLHLNNVDRTDFLKLPGMTEELADAYTDWRDSDDEVTGQGAENGYYTGLPVPHTCKNGPIETVDELMLLKGFTPELLLGLDLNRDGVIDAREESRGGGGVASTFGGAGGAVGRRGLLPYLTVYTVDPNVTIDGQPRANFKTAPATGGNTGGAPGTGGTGAAGGTAATSTAPTLEDVVNELLPAARAAEVIRLAREPATGAAPANLFQFAAKTRLTQAELHLLADRLTESDQKTFPGRININTAPREVLLTLPGLEAADVDKLLAARDGADLTSVAWAYVALGPEKAGNVGGRVTGRSYQYSADILAVSADGRAFKRVRIVVDARTAPARVVYRRDLTDLGWPLDPAIRTALGKGERLTEISAHSKRITSGANTAVARAN